jgi:hypothetical protein
MASFQYNSIGELIMACCRFMAFYPEEHVMTIEYSRQNGFSIVLEPPDATLKLVHENDVVQTLTTRQTGDFHKFRQMFGAKPDEPIEDLKQEHFDRFVRFIESHIKSTRRLALDTLMPEVKS